MSQRPILQESGRSAAGHAFWRVLVLGFSLVFMLSLLGLWWFLKASSYLQAGPERSSVLGKSFPEPEFSDDATVEQLLELADREINTMLAQWPASAAAYDIKANRDFQLSDTQAARNAWTRALQLDPNDADALFGLANLAFEEGDYDESARICELLTRAHPGNPRVPLLLADSYLHSAKPQLAVFTLEQHIASEPASLQAWQMLGNAQLNLREYDKAISCFERALEFAPDSKDAHYGLGQAYVRTGKTDLAKESMRRFQELAKVSSDENATEAQAFVDRAYAAHVAAQVYVDGALLYLENGDSDTAEERLLRALRLQPDVIAWLQELEDLYQLQGRIREAADVLQRLAELEPDGLENWLRLGGFYAEINEPSMAVAALKKAIEIDPTDARCVRARQVIEQLEKQP